MRERKTWHLILCLFGMLYLSDPSVGVGVSFLVMSLVSSKENEKGQNATDVQCIISLLFYIISLLVYTSIHTLTNGYVYCPVYYIFQAVYILQLLLHAQIERIGKVGRHHFLHICSPSFCLSVSLTVFIIYRFLRVFLHVFD